VGRPTALLIGSLRAVRAEQDDTRIEDTDASAIRQRLVTGNLDGTEVVGVEWDKGAFYQSQRTAVRAAAKKKSRQAAPLCYASEKIVLARHTPEPGQDDEPKGGGAGALRVWQLQRPATPSTTQARQNRRPFQGPSSGGTTKFTDVSWRNRILQRRKSKIFVCLRSGKGTREILASEMIPAGLSLDDHDMRITRHAHSRRRPHSNTPKQVLIYRASATIRRSLPTSL